MPPIPNAIRTTRITVVTGFPCSGKTRWLRNQVSTLFAGSPNIRIGVIQLEQGRSRLNPSALGWPAIRSHIALSACPCCPPIIDIPALLADWSDIDELFIEVPASFFSVWIADFDKCVAQPRKIILCTGRISPSADPSSGPSFFLSTLCTYADDIIRTTGAG